MARQGKQDSTTGTSRRGFASMDPQRQREIASAGGRAAHGGKATAASGGAAAGAAQGSPRGGSSARHAAAGRQSHKNS